MSRIFDEKFKSLDRKMFELGKPSNKETVKLEIGPTFLTPSPPNLGTLTTFMKNINLFQDILSLVLTIRRLEVDFIVFYLSAYFPKKCSNK